MQRINNDIKNGQFQQIYLLYGDERYLRRQYRDKLKVALCSDGQQMNYHFFEGKNISITEIIDLSETLPFFSDKRIIFIEDSGLYKAGGEQLAQYLPEVNSTTIFVFNESEIDKRSKLYKEVKNHGCIVEFTTQEEALLKRWIAGNLKKEGKKITENTVNLFLTKVGTDMENISMELEKLSCYCIDKEIVTEEDVEAVCTNRISNQIFEMINAIADKKKQMALQLYYDLLALKEAPMRILFLIARQCNMLLQVKEMKKMGHANKEMASKLGLPPFVVGKYITQADKFKTKDLKRAVLECVEAEEAVKTGKMNDKMSIELLIMTVL